MAAKKPSLKNNCCHQPIFFFFSTGPNCSIINLEAAVDHGPVDDVDIAARF